MYTGDSERLYLTRLEIESHPWLAEWAQLVCSYLFLLLPENIFDKFHLYPTQFYDNLVAFLYTKNCRFGAVIWSCLKKKFYRSFWILQCTYQDHHKFFCNVHVTYGHGPSPPVWHCGLLCSSGLMDDVVLFHNGSYGYHCNDVAVAQTNTPAVWC